MRALAIAVHHADDILAAPLVGPDDHQDALLVMVHARREIDISLGRQVALSPSFVLVPPQRLQPGNGARRKARSVPPHKRGKGLAEIAARDPLQIKPRQQLLHRSGAPQIARQDRRRETDPPARPQWVAIPRPRRLDPDRPDPGLDLALRQIAVPHNAAAARGVGQIRMGHNMPLDFRFNRLGQQLTRPGPQNVRQRIIRK